MTSTSLETSAQTQSTINAFVNADENDDVIEHFSKNAAFSARNNNNEFFFNDDDDEFFHHDNNFEFTNQFFRSSFSSRIKRFKKFTRKKNVIKFLFFSIKCVFVKSLALKNKFKINFNICKINKTIMIDRNQNSARREKKNSVNNIFIYCIFIFL